MQFLKSSRKNQFFKKLQLRHLRLDNILLSFWGSFSFKRISYQEKRVVCIKREHFYFQQNVNLFFNRLSISKIVPLVLIVKEMSLREANICLLVVNFLFLDLKKSSIYSELEKLWGQQRDSKLKIISLQQRCCWFVF